MSYLGVFVLRKHLFQTYTSPVGEQVSHRYNKEDPVMVV